MATLTTSVQQALLFPPCSFRGQLTAVQHIKKMRGGSQSQLMLGSDHRYWVVKLQGNPQDDRVLANELFASRLGRRLALPTPEVEIIKVSDWLIQNTPELRAEYAGYSRPFNCGLQLASKYVGDPVSAPAVDDLPERLFSKIVNRSDFGKVLILDKWTSNADSRQAVFTTLPSGAGYAAHFVDQGYAFNAGQWDFPDLPLQGVFFRNQVYQNVTSWQSFEPTLSAAEQMDISEIWSCAAGIPPEWYGGDVCDLERLVENLYYRRSRIRDLVRGFRTSSRNPFPNWTED